MGVQRKITRGTFNSISIGMAFSEFMAEKEAMNLSRSTLKNYEISYQYFMAHNDFTDDTDLGAVTQNNFYSWINSLKVAGNRPASINHYLRDCRAFFYWCMAEDREYLKRFRIALIKGQEEQQKYFKDQDILALLSKPKLSDSFSDWRTWAIVNWVLGTGNRSSTIVDVQMGDIDYKCKEITLRHTKNKRAQIIPLSSSLEIVLREYIHTWLRDASPEDYLFPNVGAEQLTTNALRHSFSRYCKSRGVDQTNIHGLRHSFARSWVRNNGNMFALQKILGHQTLDMVRNYVKLSVEDIKEDYDTFSPLDNIKRGTSRTHVIRRSSRY